MKNKLEERYTGYNDKVYRGNVSDGLGWKSRHKEVDLLESYLRNEMVKWGDSLVQ